MSYQGEETTKIKKQYTRDAIALAMESRWEEAITANKNILKLSPTDVDTYNRLGRAFTELGEYEQAINSYKKALELNPKNQIAQKNLSRLSLLSTKDKKDKKAPVVSHKIMPQIFLEEIGKAGVVSLENLAPVAVLARMSAGDQVSLRVRGQSLEVETSAGDRLGKVESRHGLRLIKLIEGGNNYAAAITNVGPDGVKIIIKESFQHPSQVGRLSFPVKEEESFRPYLRETILHYEARGEEEEEALEEGEEPSEREEEAEAFADSFTLVQDSSFKDLSETEEEE